MSDKEDDLHDAVSAMADRLGLKGRDRTRYVHEHMTRGGYKAVPTYVPADADDDDDDSSPFFGSGGRRRRSDAGQSRSSGRRRRTNDDEDWYDD